MSTANIATYFDPKEILQNLANADASAWNKQRDVQLNLHKAIDPIVNREIKSLMLVAHAGDGKSHWIKSLETEWKEENLTVPVRIESGFDFQSIAAYPTPTLFLVNDATFLSDELCKNVISIAFETGPSMHTFVVAINRGLLTNIAPKLDSGPKTWVSEVLNGTHTAYSADCDKRLAIPLDRRVLVSGLGGKSDESPTRRAQRIMSGLDQMRANSASQLLSLVEACGHHVTFRELLVYSAWISVQVDEESAFAAMYCATDEIKKTEVEDSFPRALSSIRSLLRRLDPAQMARPDLDLKFGADDRARNYHCRKEADIWLGDLFKNGKVASKTVLPFKHAPDFFQHCLDLSTHNVIPLKPESALIAGLAKAMWNGECSVNVPGLLPLAYPLHPSGGAAAGGGWRILDGALDHSCLTLRSLYESHPGEYVEAADLRFALHVGADGPTLQLDLELFEYLCKLGGNSAKLSGAGKNQHLLAQFSSQLIACYREVLGKATPTLDHVGKLTGHFVSFETLIDGQQKTHPPIPMSQPMLEVGKCIWERPAATTSKSISDFLIQIASKPDAPPFAPTPAACASALIQWAGWSPALHDVTNSQKIYPEWLSVTLGINSLDRWHSRSDFARPVFPWSRAMLGLASKKAPEVSHEDWHKHASAFGGALSQALIHKADPLAFQARIAFIWASDEVELDAHASSRLSHQTFSLPHGGKWLEFPSSVDSELLQNVQFSIGERVLARLLEDTRFPLGAERRWWLIGVWSAWWGFRQLSSNGKGVLFPEPTLRKEFANSQRDYEGALERLVKPQNAGKLALKWGQAAGFLSPPNARTKVRFSLTSDAISDILSLIAWDLVVASSGKPNDRSLSNYLQNAFECGIYAYSSNTALTNAEVTSLACSIAGLPKGNGFRQALIESLDRLRLIDRGSDGGELIKSPW